MSLSDRLRPDVEAAPWVIKEVNKLEEELDAAWMALGLVQKETARLREALEEILSTVSLDWYVKQFGKEQNSSIDSGIVTVIHNRDILNRVGAAFKKARAALEEK